MKLWFAENKIDPSIVVDLYDFIQHPRGVWGIVYNLDDDYVWVLWNDHRRFYFECGWKKEPLLPIARRNLCIFKVQKPITKFTG